MPAKKQSKINLLPQEEFEASTFGRVLTWTLSSFRIIVILTELTVMLAFLSRFWLDARLTDLNELIKQRQAIIVAQAGFEKDFRVLQKRLSIFASLQSGIGITPDSLKTITSYLPQDVSLSNFMKTDKAIQISGTSASERSIAQFIANLEGSGTFGTVTLGNAQINPADQTSLVFIIKITPKGKEAKG